MNVQLILKEITSFRKGNRFILGLDGLSRSGKTTIAEELSKHLEEKNIPFYVFHMDDHIVERKKRYHTGREEWFEYYYLQWDIPWLSTHFFEKLRFSNKFELPFYCNSCDTVSYRTLSIPDGAVVVIEGVFLQREAWLNYFDSLVFIECSRETRFLRESTDTQVNINKFKERYWKAEDYYLETECPKKKANLVLQG
ncbi:kinase [Mesobacillus zeae]|uniref:Phosphoribulokinase/uridine kinase domain-containing protein n=1 Tax=Mesobacillus zeae TaxID=1917180 RepID=A0A398B7E6_9BACI|nr:kinase [Mesobacillus zeae]RID85885.1 hypothetical protein D1970_08265 [Mesobacillus zeae]